MFRGFWKHSGLYAMASAGIAWAVDAASQPAEPTPAPAMSFEERFTGVEPAEPLFTQPEIQRLLSSLPSSALTTKEPASEEELGEQEPQVAATFPAWEAIVAAEGWRATFDERFSVGERAEPFFTQSDVQELLAALPSSSAPDENIALAEEEPVEPQPEEVAAPAEMPVRPEQPDSATASVEPDQPAPSEESVVATQAEAVRREPETTASVDAPRPISTGRATWYEHPGTTANGETFNPDAMTAAHHTLPFGTRLRVVNLKTGQSVVVRINDRIPRRANALIDLSRASAKLIGITGDGQVALFQASDEASAGAARK